MKRNILYMALSLAVLLPGAYVGAAQANSSYNGDIAVKPVRLAQSGETLHVEMDFIMREMKLYPTTGVDLVPRLVSPSDTLELPRISLKGRNEYSAYERKLLLMGKAEASRLSQPYKVEKRAKKESYTIPYRYTTTFEPWMENAYLEFRCDESGCGRFLRSTRNRIADSVILDRIPVPYLPTPYMAFIQPVAEQVKNRERQVETFLDFEVNKTGIRPEYMNNPRELAKIRSMIDELRTDNDVTIKRLDIIGYASPEGSLANNKRLSEGRANALKNYLASQYDFPESAYRTTFGGENWEGLRTALTTFNVEHKDHIEYIIDNYEGEDRKNRLKNLQGGEPYKHLLKNVYPSLRVAVCKVEYQVRSFSVEEAKEIIKVRPQNLSLNEMYLVANTYPVGSQEFIEVFETAVRLFPHDEVARLNAAASALLHKNTETAERYLNLINNRKLPEYLNAAGVLAMLQDDYDTAEKHLKEASASGLDIAGKNLEELKKVRQNKLEINK